MSDVPSSSKRAAPTGRVSAVRGAVIDARFEEGELPAIEEALIVEKDSGEEIYAEVQAHLDRNNIRAIALQSTVGLSRGRRVRATGGPIEITVGDATLGRLIEKSSPIRPSSPSGSPSRSDSFFQVSPASKLV